MVKIYLGTGEEYEGNRKSISDKTLPQEDNLRIRRANLADLPRIIEIYDKARIFMRRSGNPTQWGDGYPGEDDIRNDISNSNLYVGEDDAHGAVFVFAFIIGEDPTYRNIKGEWADDSPYGTIHRIASSGIYNEVLAKSMQFCESHISSIRIDTHSDNLPMIKAIKKCGFKYCGEIICRDGTPRMAFQYSKSNL